MEVGVRVRRRARTRRRRERVVIIRVVVRREGCWGCPSVSGSSSGFIV